MIGFVRRLSRRIQQRHEPRTLDQAVDRLHRQFPIATRVALEDTEERFVSLSHSRGGMWIRNTWGFWEGRGPLFDSLKAQGIHHPDDMSSVILHAFWRKVHQKPLDIEGLKARYDEHWRNMGIKPEESFKVSDADIR